MDSTPKILVVDDEPDTCANLSDIFTDLGYQVDVAYDGPSALELIRERYYDVALLDLKMPGMDGLELYQRLRQVSAGTVAIIVTAYAGGETAKNATEAGAWRILSKPVNFKELLGLVGEAIEQPLILIVDDDEELCNTLWDLMRERGFRVCLAHDAVAGCQMVKRKEHQLVLIDLKLPQGSGTDVLHAVHEQNPQARTILITGFRNELEQFLQDVLSHGADAVCYKPFNVDELLTTVNKFAH